MERLTLSRSEESERDTRVKTRSMCEKQNILLATRVACKSLTAGTHRGVLSTAPSLLVLLCTQQIPTPLELQHMNTLHD